MTEECPFERVIYNFRNLEALGLWLYLSNQPQSGRIIKDQIKRHFGIGTDRVNRLISTLVAHHLLKVIREKDIHGRFISAQYALNDPTEFIYVPCVDQPW